MEPTLTQGDDVLVLCWLFKLEVGDLVVIKKQGRKMVKRVKKAEKDRIFAVGDNEKVSIDSRSFGWLFKKDIIGKVIWHKQSLKQLRCY